jgi:RNA 2',3'-cyclic 3'-phosphodiesterase
VTALPALARAFVAVVPPAPVLDAVEAVLAPVRPAAPPRLTWARRAQWHLTLRFLGRVDDTDALMAGVHDALATHPPFVLGLGGAGAFPSAARAAVVWIGLDQGHDDLVACASGIERATRPLGHEPDPRPFRPHLTVARARRPLPVGPLLGALGDGPVGPAWDAREVLLMESDTRPTGAVYHEVGRVPLGG